MDTVTEEIGEPEDKERFLNVENRKDGLLNPPGCNR